MKFGSGRRQKKTAFPHIERVRPRRLFRAERSPFMGAASSRARSRVRWCVSGKPKPALRSPARIVWWLAFRKGRTRSGARRHGRHESPPHPVHIGLQIADNLHPVANPAVDLDGQHLRHVFRPAGPACSRFALQDHRELQREAVHHFVDESSGLALDRMGNLFVSCRSDGTIHRITPDGRAEEWIEGMGVATGIAFDPNGNLYVGDRSGTVFKISPSREIFVFATLEPSIAAYHLAFHPGGDLYVSGADDLQL